MKHGIMKLTIEGMKISFNTPSEVTILPFHSIMVVTSPIGEKAPPALAAITIIEA